MTSGCISAHSNENLKASCRFWSELLSGRMRRIKGLRDREVRGPAPWGHTIIREAGHPAVRQLFEAAPAHPPQSPHAQVDPGSLLFSYYFLLFKNLICYFFISTYCTINLLNITKSIIMASLSVMIRDLWRASAIRGPWYLLAVRGPWYLHRLMKRFAKKQRLMKAYPRIH